MKSVLYARVSTEEQKNNQTIDTQIHGIGGMLQYAANKKLPIPDESMIFIDDGFSGATLIRPALTALREYLKTHDDVGYFLVYDADRIGRDTYNQLIILEELKKKNITIHFKTGELGSTPNDKLLFTILSAFSEFERAKIMERTQRGMKRRIESGKFNGGRPLYGFKYNHTLGKHELDDNEVRVVRMMYDWYTEDEWNIRQIQAKLFELKILSKYDALKNTEKNKKLKGLKKHPIGWWSEATIRNVLTNEAYTGRWYCGKNYTVKLEIPNLRTGKPKVRQFRRPKEEWFPIEVPRIVSDEQFKKASLQARKNLMYAKRCTKQTYLLQGLIRCGKDGLKYRGHQEKSGVIYYYCKSRMSNNPTENCKSPYLRADQVEPIVWNTVKSFLEKPEEVFNAFRNESILNEERVKSTHGRLLYIDAAIKKLETAKKRITEAFKAEAMTLQEFRKEKTDIELGEEKLISERDGLKNKLNIQNNVDAKIDLFQETCHRFLSKINDPKTVTERLKKAIIRLIIDEVAIDGEKLKISATIPFPNKIHEREIVKTDFPDTFNAGATLGPVNETNMTRIWNKHRQLNTTLKPKVFVALSGGVDSSVAAALLMRAGYDVYGVYMKEWVPPGIACTAGDDRQTAARAAAHLGIPFAVWDLSDEYRREVAEYMVREYAAGMTPNPDILCNKRIKFGAFLRRAREAGADYIATGHYVRLQRKITNHKSQITNNNQIPNSKFEILAAEDSNKDQSYFLWTLTQDQLRHCLFPIGGYTKPQIRAMAKKYGLPNWDRKDSQGVCFTGQFDFGAFLRMQIPQRQGAVVTADGREVGRHDGAEFATIGQRIGIKNYESGIKGKTNPVFVAHKDIAANRLIVAEERDPALYKKEAAVTDVNWISGALPKLPLDCFARIRYRQPLQACTLSRVTSYKLRVTFHESQRAVAPGQSAVFYKKNGEVLGGGVIVE